MCGDEWKQTLNAILSEVLDCFQLDESQNNLVDSMKSFTVSLIDRADRENRVQLMQLDGIMQLDGSLQLDGGMQLDKTLHLKNTLLFEQLGNTLQLSSK